VFGLSAPGALALRSTSKRADAANTERILVAAASLTGASCSIFAWPAARRAGPFFDAAGACLGMSTFGPRGQVIVIPTATIERIVPLLLKDGRIARGWLGVALQAVAVPDALRENTTSPAV